MPPVFVKADSKVNGIFTASDAYLTMGAGLIGALVQGLNFTFSQNVTRLYEINTQKGAQKANVYLVGGRSQGQCQLNRIVGPHASIKTLYQKFGNVCAACDNNITLDLSQANCATAGCTGGQESLSYDLKDCVLVQIGISVQAQDMIINEQSQIMFNGLEYK